MTVTIACAQLGFIDMKPTIRHYNDKTGQISTKIISEPTNQVTVTGL